MFINPDHADIFHRQGYVQFPIMDAAGIKVARDIFFEFEEAHHWSTEKFRGTGWIQKDEIVNKINERVYPLAYPYFEKNFRKFEVLGFNFLLKESGNESAVPMHQDWTYVDESRFYSMNIWIALEDIKVSNGCLFMIPGSHRVGKYLRPSPSYPIPFSSIKFFLERFKRPVILRAGECVCFSNKMIHGSYPNLSESYRLALVSTLYPASSRLLHHYADNTDKPEEVTEYEIDKTTFLNIKRGKAPDKFISSRKVRTKYPSLHKFDFLPQLLRNFSPGEVFGNWRKA